MNNTTARLVILVAACLPVACWSAGEYSSDPGHRSVVRTAELSQQTVGDPITVAVTLSNSESAAVRAFYYTDHVPQGLDVATVSVTVDGTAATGYLYEVGYADEVFPGAVPHRWILETPPDLTESLPVTSTCTIVYTLTSSTEGSYALPGYTWVGYDAAAALGVFGYETDPPTFEFVSAGSGTGTVHVDVTPDAGAWTVIDGAGGDHSGTGDATLTDIPVGTIQIAYDPLVGYRPPPDSSQTLTMGGVITFAGIYTYAAPIAVITSPADHYDLASSSQIVVTGTAQNGDGDPSDFLWVLDRTEQPLPCDTWVVLATGTDNVVDGTLALWPHHYGLAPGEYVCRLRCTNEYGASSVERTFENNLDVPAEPSSPVPPSGAQHITSLDALSWQWSTLAHHSDLYLWLSDEPRPDEPTAADLVVGSWPVPGPLGPYTEYLWQVVAVNGAGTTEGPVWSFTTDDPTPPTVPGRPVPQCAFVTSASYPAGRYYAMEPGVAFVWSAAYDQESGVDTYHVRAGTVPESADLYDGDVGNVVTCFVPADAGHVVYARVAARNGDGAWSGYGPTSPAVNVLAAGADHDVDGLTTSDELDVYNTDPTEADTDGDQLLDGYEVTVALTDPTTPDTDGDGVPDGEEDPDGDGYTTLDECRAGRDPRDPLSRPSKLRMTDALGSSVTSYVIGRGSIYVEVDQPTQNKDGLAVDTLTVTIGNAATGDSETVVLTETDVSSGVFFSETGLPTRPSAQSLPNDGTLQSQTDSLVRATYIDPDVPEDTVTEFAHLKRIPIRIYQTPSGTLRAALVLSILMMFTAWMLMWRRHRPGP